MKTMPDMNFLCLVDGPKPGFKMAPSKWEEVDGAALQAQGTYPGFLMSISVSSFVFSCLKTFLLMFYLQL